MSFNDQIINPSAIKLIEYIGAGVSRMTLNTPMPSTYYEISARRSFEFEDDLPFINFRAVLMVEEGEVPEDQSQVDMAIFHSKRRLVQVCLKANVEGMFIVRLAEAHPNGEVFYYEERMISTSAVYEPGLLDVNMLASQAVLFLTTGQRLKLG